MGRRNAFGQMEYGLPLQVEEKKTVGDGWEVAGYCSTFNNVDHVGDIVLPGAFTKTLTQDKQTLFLYCHDIKQMLGVPLVLREDQKGLFGRFRISRTPLGETIHTLMEDGAPFGFSIGFFPDEYEYNDEGNRLLKQIDLVEDTLAPVPILANPQAQVTAFKTLLGLEDLDRHAVWDTAYVNNLPDAAFAGVEPGGTKDGEGKTVPRTLRHLPHHDSSVKSGTENGSVDLPHLRNALARVEQMQDGGPEFKARCRSHLVAHAKALNVGDYSSGGGKTIALPDFDPAELPFDAAWDTVTGLLHKGLTHTKLFYERRREEGREPTERHADVLRSVLRTLEGAQADVKHLLQPDGASEGAKAPTTEGPTQLQALRERVRRKLARHPDLMPLLEG